MAEKLVIKNVGTMLSGAMEAPILDADTVIAIDGRIADIGKEKDVDTGVGRHCDQQEKPGHQKRNHQESVADHEHPAAIYLSIENLISR